MSGAVLYLRVSTEEQVSNLSLDVQDAACRELCAREGWQVLEAFREEGASAKTIERPQLQRLLAYVGKNAKRVDHVVVYRVDRLSRNREDYFVLLHALRRHGVRLVSAKEQITENSIEAVIVETFSILQAQVDNIIRSGRARSGMTEAARRGRWVWQAPVGYRIAARDGDGRATGLELDPDAAPLVRRGFELVAAGVSIRSAHAELAEAGLRIHGRPVRYEVFRRMLRRPLYSGRLECAALGVAADSRAPAIVDPTTWSRVQQAIDRTSLPYRRRPEASAEFPLRGVVRCAACDRRLVAYRARGKSGRKWPYYRCLKCDRNMPAHRIESAWSRLLERSSAPDVVVALLDRAISRLVDQRAASLQERISRARRKLAAAEDRLERLLAMRIEGEISTEEYQVAKARVAAARDAARVELADVVAPAAATATSGWARRLLTRPLQVWLELTPERRAMLAGRLFPEGVKLTEDGELSNPVNSLLQLPLSSASADGYSESGP